MNEVWRSIVKRFGITILEVERPLIDAQRVLVVRPGHLRWRTVFQAQV